MDSPTLDSASHILSPEDVARLYEEGFLVIRHLTTTEDVSRIEQDLDGVLARGGVDFGNVVRPSANAVSLKKSLAFIRCWQIARQILGVTAWPSFDAAIYKPPLERIGTRWHQDQAYNDVNRHSDVPLSSLHFWLPLQPVDAHNGCLRYIPHSHYSVLPHTRLTEDCWTVSMSSGGDRAAQACPMEVGDVAVHLSTTIHSALPNTTARVRKAWTLHFRRFGRFASVGQRLAWIFRELSSLGLVSSAPRVGP